MKRNATFGMPLVFFKCPSEETIAGFPSASLPLYSSPTHHGFNSKAAEVISILFFDSYIFTRLPNTSLLNDWTDITVSVHEDFFGALLFPPSRLFCKKATQ